MPGGRGIGAAIIAVFAVITAISGGEARGQGFPNVARTPGELLAGPIAPEQGRTAIIAWHGERIVTVPEAPGSQPGADVQMRVVDISDPTNPQVTHLPAHAGGFHAHGYFHNGPYLFVGPHCLTSSLQPCGGSGSIWADSFRIGGAGTAIGGSQLRRASMESDAGLPIGGIDKSGAQSPWGVRDFWSYNDVSGTTFLAVRRSLAEWIYDWPNGGDPVGPAVRATWDHLALTGVVGFPFIMGNILIFAADQTGSGVAAYDISDPTNPVLIDVLKDENPGGYWPEVYGHYIFFPRRDGEGGAGSQAGFMVVDFSDPTDLRVVADRNLEGSNQYVTFQDEFAFMNNYKIDMRTFDVALELPTNDVTLDASQFALPIGNLVATGGYGTLGPGLAIWAHQAAPDTLGPFVAYHVPRPDQTNYSIHCPITLSVPETLRTETIVNGTSLIVRPVGGSPIPLWHSFGQGKLLTVTPRQPLAPDTTYEVLLTNAIQDAAGNGMEPYSFRFSTGGGLSGGNRPPAVGAIDANPNAGPPGALVQFAWSGSDPDGDSLEYRIDFGDGSPKTAWSATASASHSYAEAGHYQATVQARDPGGSVAAGSRTVTAAPAPIAPNSTASGPLALDSAGARIYAVNPDNDTVSAVDANTLAKLWEAPVGREPRSIARAADGSLWVACLGSDSIDILNPATGARETRIELDYGAAPVAIAATPDGATMLASCEGDEALRRFSSASRAQTGSVALGPWPRAIAVTQDGTRALVARFVSREHEGQVYDVSLAGGMTLTRTIRLARDHSTDGSASSRGVPNYLAGIRIAPDGRWAWVAGKKDNTTRGTFFGAEMIPGQDTTVRAQIQLIDLQTNAEDLARRLDIDNSDSPSAVVFSPLGDYAFVALQGNAQIAVIDVLDFMRQDSPGTVRTRWATGLAPQGAAMDAATGRLFTHDLMSRSLTAIEAGEFLASGAANVASQPIGLVAEERLNAEVLLGKQIFYHASDPRMSAEGYISCATCHIDGMHDGRTWDFTNRGEGFRNTIDLRGRNGIGQGAVHWTANFDEIQDFENDIRGAFGGAGFMDDGDFASASDPLGAAKTGLSADLDALSAYVSSLGPAALPRSPAREANGALSAAAVRGAAVFAAQNCASCHNPATDYTDHLAHNVGTLRASSGGRLGGPLAAIDTPTLLGLHASDPYFHDGSAATLAEVFAIAGGRLEQAEAGNLGSGAFAEDVDWHPNNDWHGGQFVELDGARSITFDNIASASAGPGFVEVRYSSGYGNSQLSLTVNGAGVGATLPIVPNDPMWFPNEWRIVRIPVNYLAGNNTIVFREGPTGAQLRVDDMLFATAGDLALASAHVRNLTAGDRADLIEFLLSLDGSDAAAPSATVSREATIPHGGVDAAEAPIETGEFALVYLIENTGAAPLNLGQAHAGANPGGDVRIERQPAAQLAPGGTTEIELRVTASAAPTSAEIFAWADDPATGEIRWTLQVAPDATNSVGGGWELY